MEYFAGTDVSLEASSVCLVDSAGHILYRSVHSKSPGSQDVRALLTGRKIVPLWVV
jgi:hypothetical protein